MALKFSAENVKRTGVRRRPCCTLGKSKPTPLLKFFKTALRGQYDILCNAYTFYGCRQDPLHSRLHHTNSPLFLSSLS